LRPELDFLEPIEKNELQGFGVGKSVREYPSHFALDTAADEIAALARGFVGSSR